MAPSAFLISTFPQYFTIAFPLPNRYNKSSIVEGRLQMKKRGKKKWIGIVAAAVVVLAVAAVFAWKYFGDGELKIPKLAAVPIDEEHFPDEYFRLYVSRNYDVNEDGVLSGLERWKVRECGPLKRVKDLKGIEYFPRLKELSCSTNNLESLDVSKNTELQYLTCAYNKLKSLDVSHNVDLRILYCNSNGLESLNVTGCVDLEYLDCSNNELSGLDVSTCSPRLRIIYEDNPMIQRDIIYRSSEETEIP